MKTKGVFALALVVGLIFHSPSALALDSEQDVIMKGNVRVVLDPAQGGGREGAHGEGVVREKEIVLAFARVLASRLEAMGLEPRLTRETDKEMTPEERATFANRVAPALFLSLQARGVELREAKGLEAFYQAAPPQSANPDEWRAGQFYSQAKSKELALALSERVSREAGMKTRGAREIESPLLGAIASPAAIISLGNLSAPEEAEILASDAGRKKLAEALAKTIADFVEKYKK